MQINFLSIPIPIRVCQPRVNVLQDIIGNGTNYFNPTILSNVGQKMSMTRIYYYGVVRMV
jgi:hypothetical protein